MSAMEELGKLEYDPGLVDEDFESGPCPEDLALEEQPFGMDFHPSQNLLAVGLVSGAVSVYRYSAEGNECILDGTAGPPQHQAAVRSVRFDGTGRVLLSTGTDMSLVVLDAGTLQQVHRNPRIHGKAVSAMACFDTHTLATGDEDGVVKLWDLRQQRETCMFHDNEDFISDFAWHPDRKRLLATGGDGYLSVFNPRAGKLDARSDNMDDELLSVRWIKGGKFAVVGTQEGVLNFWKVRREGVFCGYLVCADCNLKNGDWGNICTRFPGHPESVDALQVIEEDTIVTGSSDGMLRVVSVMPNKLLGLIGEHGDFPIEAIGMSYNKSLLASASHDNLIKFWNIDYLFDEDGDDEQDGEGGAREPVPMDEGEDHEADNRGKRVDRGGEPELSKNKQKKQEFFSGL